VHPNINGEHNIIYAACTQNGYEVLRYLLKHEAPISEIVSLTPNQAEQNHVSGYQSFAEIAEQNDIPVYYPETYEMTTEKDIEHFRKQTGDVLIVNGWQRLIPKEILNTLTRCALGVHGSAYGLPQGRGRSPLNWSVIENLDRFLHSVIKLSPGADDGDIVDTRKFEITDHDDIRTLYYKSILATQEILSETLQPILEGKFEFTPQTGTPTHYPKRNPEDGAICWEEPTRDIYNLVRAVAKPYPGAFTEHDDETVMIWEAIPFSKDFVFDAAPGTIVQIFKTNDEFLVKTADGTLLVREWEADQFTPRQGDKLVSSGEPDRVDKRKS
jgi:methionyl-tRNA formyltransferase